MSYFKHHLLICINRRDEGETCCADHNAEAMFEHAKKKAKQLGLQGPDGTCRITRSGCLGRCEKGPVAVVYPDAVWYTFIDESDIDEIVESHLRDGKVVERLLVD